jgi:hypothetical protein
MTTQEYFSTPPRRHPLRRGVPSGIVTILGTRIKGSIVMRGATEAQAQDVASRLNYLIPHCTQNGRRFRVLDVYPPCNTKRVVLT